MKPSIRLIWLFCAAVTVVLAVDAWRTWGERSDPIRRWRKALREGNAAERREAANMLGQQDDPAYVPDLLGALNDPDRDVRVLAFHGLSQLLTSAEGAESGEVSPAATASLMRCARKGIASHVRVMAIGALAKGARDDAKVRAAFQGWVEDAEEDEEVRAAAFRALGEEWQVAGAGAAYRSDPSPALRLAAMECLLAARDRRHPRGAGLPAVPYCDAAIRGLGDPDPRIRLVAATLPPSLPKDATGPWRRALPGLIAAFSDADPEVRERAGARARALAIGTDHAPSVIEALEARLGDPDPVIRTWASRMIAGFGAAGGLAEPWPGGARRRRDLGILLGWLAWHLPHH